MPSQKTTGLKRRSPLKRFWGDSEYALMQAGDAQIQELPFQGVIRLQTRDSSDAFLKEAKEILGCDLPLVPNTCAGQDPICLWVAPNEWVLLTPPEKDQALLELLCSRLIDEFKEVTVAATLISDARCVLEVSGASAADLLAKGCSLDLDPKVFSVGSCASSLLEQVPMTIYPENEGAFVVIIDRSYAAFVWEWLAHASKEFAVFS